MPTIPGKRRTDDQKMFHKYQTAWGAWVVFAGLAAIVGAFAIAAAHFSKASEFATAVASVSGVIAAMVGAYFGVRGTTVAQGQAMEMLAKQLKSQGDVPPEGAPGSTVPASTATESPSKGESTSKAGSQLQAKTPGETAPTPGDPEVAGSWKAEPPPNEEPPLQSAI
jgi:hypothetical protein